VLQLQAKHAPAAAAAKLYQLPKVCPKALQQQQQQQPNQATAERHVTLLAYVHVVKLNDKSALKSGCR
jgi:hypothetical protein